MVDLTPSNALIAALANQFAAARQGQGQGVGSFIPGLPGAAETTSSAPNALSPVGAIGGGVPSTATTGQSVANSLASGGVGSDPVAAQVARVFGQREPGERGDLGVGVTGGDIGTLLTVLGGPLAPATLLASLVASDALGLDLDPSLLSTTSLAELVTGERETLADSFDRSRALGAEIGGPIGGDFTVGTRPGGGTVNAIRGGVIGRQESEIDRGGGPGAGPSRGAAGAGNRGR